MLRFRTPVVRPVLLGVCALAASVLLLSACDTAGCEGGALEVEDVVVGDGVEATTGSTVTVAYTGMLEDGDVFDESASYTAPLSNFIEGFREGVTGMRVGGERRLTIPPEMAYGEAGIAGTIPSCATLVFDVTLLDVE